MREGEPRLSLQAVVVKTCKGEIESHAVQGAKDGEIAAIQLKIAVEHDKNVHKKSEPCRKSFYTR